MGQQKLEDRANQYLSFEELSIIAPKLTKELDQESVFTLSKELYLLTELIYQKFKDEKKDNDPY